MDDNLLSHSLCVALIYTAMMAALCATQTRVKLLPRFLMTFFPTLFDSTGVTGLYFPQNEYIETVYVGQTAGTPILQVHAMMDHDYERPHFYLCYLSSIRRPPYYSSWFHLDINTGVLYLNKTLEESDFTSLSESQASVCFVYSR